MKNMIMDKQLGEPIGEPTKLLANVPKKMHQQQGISESARRCISDADIAAGEKSRHDAEVQHRQSDAWSMCGVQKRHRKTIDLLGHDQWRSKYQTLCDLLGTGFLAALLGPRGTGKTQMAAELIRRYIFNADAPSCRYVRATDIFMAIRCAYRNDGPSERDQISGFTRPQLLVIEESHVRGGSDWEDRLLTDLIDRRYGAMKDTLLLSNQNEQDFRASIGYSVYSRLTETGGVIMCDWESFRTPGTGATR